MSWPKFRGGETVSFNGFSCLITSRSRLARVFLTNRLAHVLLTNRVLPHRYQIDRRGQYFLDAHGLTEKVRLML